MNALQRNHKTLLAFALAAVALAGAWLPQASYAAALDEATKGNGNGGGNGKPGGGELAAELQPNVWNTNYSHSEGTVSALIRGGDLGEVNLDSIVLVGTDTAEEPVAPLRVSRQGNQIRAFFAKDDAIASLDTPTRGEVHEVTIELTTGDAGTEKSLTAQVRIVGPDGDGGGGGGEEVDLDLAIQADHWNMSWSHSHGTVSALIRGDGLADVDLDSIELVGTDPDAEPLPALRATRNGNHIRAFFAKDDAFDTLDTPKPGEIHEITIRLTVAGTDEELTDRIRVVGPRR